MEEAHHDRRMSATECGALFVTPIAPGGICALTFAQPDWHTRQLQLKPRKAQLSEHLVVDELCLPG
ncbi:MAG: hypothetical protein SGJ27_05700 [Candidatus Melainabacteria bacterium]|nr:hypothetical protein [Candidatus Melainabacteria bacterium]